MACETWNPSFSSSPWIRGAPHKKFSWLIRTISARTSLLILARPPRRRPHEPDPPDCPEAATSPTQSGGGLDHDQTALPICPPVRQQHPEQSLTRAETWPPCACSLQDRKPMAHYEFQQQIKALAEPRPHRRKPSKDQSRHELQAIRQCPNDIVLRRIVF